MTFFVGAHFFAPVIVDADGRNELRPYTYAPQ
jgi:hypothetical protein